MEKTCFTHLKKITKCRLTQSTQKQSYFADKRTMKFKNVRVEKQKQ